MPNERITMAMIASRIVKPDCELRWRILFVRGFSLCLPLGSVPVVFTHAARGTKHCDGPSCRGPARNAQKHRSVDQRVSAIDKGPVGSEFHNRRPTGESLKVDSRAIPKRHWCVWNAGKRYELCSTFKAVSRRQRCSAS